ncbi:MAG: hypothetical protein EB150_09930, partial [Nitrososphaeria archaeon]|nr:hypothetical protein [Nitrososphaeria archaeon]
MKNSFTGLSLVVVLFCSIFSASIVLPIQAENYVSDNAASMINNPRSIQINLQENLAMTSNDKKDSDLATNNIRDHNIFLSEELAMRSSDNPKIIVVYQKNSPILIDRIQPNERSRTKQNSKMMAHLDTNTVDQVYSSLP